MSGKVSGIAVFYALSGGVLLWSGFKGQSVANTVKAITSGNASALQAQGTETVSSPSLNILDSAGGSSSSGTVPASGNAPAAFSQVEGYWTMAGGPSSVATIAAAIAEAESGLNAKAVQQGQPYATTGWGLWQITPGNSEPQIGVDSALLNPLTNARAAVAKYKAAGNSFSPWTTYTSGKYAQYMPASALTGSRGVFG